MTYILIWIIIILLIVIASTRPKTVEELNQIELNRKSEEKRRLEKVRVNDIKNKEKIDLQNKIEKEFNEKIKLHDCYNIEIPSLWLHRASISVWRIEKIKYPYLHMTYRNQGGEMVLWKFYYEELLAKIKVEAYLRH